MSTSIGNIPRDKAFSTIQSKNLQTCTGTLAANRARICDMAVIDLKGDTLVADTLNIDTIENLEHQTDQEKYILIRVNNFSAIDRFSGLVVEATQLGWILHQVYVEVDGTWSKLLSGSISSSTQPANTYPAVPGPQTDLLEGFLNFLESAFVSSGIQASHGFRIIGPENTAPRIPRFEFRIGTSRTEPTIVDNYVLYLERGPLGSTSYLMFMDGSVVGNPAGAGVMYFASPPAAPSNGLPNDPGFVTPTYLNMPTYADLSIRRYYLLPENP